MDQQRPEEGQREEQLTSYQKRVRGARDLRTHLDALSIHSIVVPRKWLCKLPSKFHRKGKPDYVVVVEKCDLLQRDHTKKRYRNLLKEAVRELCTILFTFEGVDFSLRNWPFTTEGKIACIDTRTLKRITKDMSFRRKSYKKYINKKLFTDKSRRYAESLWDEFAERGNLLNGLSAKPSK